MPIVLKTIRKELLVGLIVALVSITGTLGTTLWADSIKEKKLADGLFNDRVAMVEKDNLVMNERLKSVNEKLDSMDDRLLRIEEGIMNISKKLTK